MGLRWDLDRSPKAFYKCFYQVALCRANSSVSPHRPHSWCPPRITLRLVRVWVFPRDWPTRPGGIEVPPRASTVRGRLVRSSRCNGHAEGPRSRGDRLRSGPIPGEASAAGRRGGHVGRRHLLKLNNPKVCVGGRITRSALLLLGKAEASHLGMRQKMRQWANGDICRDLP